MKVPHSVYLESPVVDFNEEIFEDAICIPRYFDHFSLNLHPHWCPKHNKYLYLNMMADMQGGMSYSRQRRNHLQLVVKLLKPTVVDCEAVLSGAF